MIRLIKIIISVFVGVFFSASALLAQRVKVIIPDENVEKSTPQIERESRLFIEKGVAVSFLDIKDANPRVRLHAGLASNIYLKHKLYLQPGLGLSLKGGKILYSNDLFNGDAVYRLTYIEFPLMLGVKLLDKLAVEMGGYGALLVNSNFDFNGTFSTGYGAFGYEELNVFDYGLSGGVVFNVARFKIGVKYYHGLQKIASSSISEAFLGDATNHTLQVNIQHSLRFRKLFEKVF